MAEAVVAELNELLSDERWWTPEARASAAERFSPLAVRIFFDPLTEGEDGALEVRERLLPIKAVGEDRPKSVVLIGTTGAGKTTLLRQLIGTSPEERFPATSKAKTTIHDTEILVRPGPYLAAVSFVSEDEVREHLAENVIAAVAEAHDGHDDEEVLERILIHADQRMRFNYVLGDGPFQVSESGLDPRRREPGEASQSIPIDAAISLLHKTNEILGEVLVQVRSLAERLAQPAGETASQATTPDLSQELFEEELERLCRSDDTFHTVVDELMDELGKRFDLLTRGTLERRTTGWPKSWFFASEERRTFLDEVRHFTSNYYPLYGTLLTPLVSGIRVAGPFYPEWADGATRLVFHDGEGLGHTPDSASSLPNSVISRMRDADIILLADNAEQPMQAAPAAAVQEIYASGLMPKLMIGFTHLDRLDADNLPTDRARRRHILASARGVGASIRQAVGPMGGAMAERAFRLVLDERTHFLALLDKQLTSPGESRIEDARAVQSLAGLYAALAADAPAVSTGTSTPRYSLYTLGLAAHRAVKEYQSVWGGKLGVRASETRRSAWQTIKALTRRIASWPHEEGFGDLQPVADFRSALIHQISAWVHSPVGWDHGEPDDRTKEAIYGRFANELSGRLSALARVRVKEAPHVDWQRGLELSGVGSTRERARLIYEDILSSAAPSIEVAVSREANALLEELRTIVRDAADVAGVRIVEG